MTCQRLSRSKPPRAGLKLSTCQCGPERWRSLRRLVLALVSRNIGPPKTRPTSPGEGRTGNRGAAASPPTAAENGNPMLTNQGPGIRCVIYSPTKRWRLGGPNVSFPSSAYVHAIPSVLSAFLAHPLNSSRGGTPSQNVKFLGSIAFASNPILVSPRTSDFPPSPSAHVHISLLPSGMKVAQVTPEVAVYWFSSSAPDLPPQAYSAG